MSGSSNDRVEEEQAPPKYTFSQKWTRTLQACQKPILKPFLKLSNHAATHPKTYVVSIILFSFLVMILGLLTNFTSETDDDIWTPRGSKPVEHGKWIDDESNYPQDKRTALIIVHRNGKNLFGDDSSSSLALESTKRLFESLDYFRDTPRYDELCSTYSTYTNPSTNETTCQIVSASTFWNDSAAVFEEQATSDENVLTTMSAENYPYGGTVDRDQIIGYNKFDTEGILNYGETYVTVIFLPPDKEDDDTTDAFSKEFEKDAIDRMLDLQKQWEDEGGNDFRVEIIADRSFGDEFERAVTQDFPLLPVVFVLMSFLCIVIFARRDKVLSRSWLGFGAVVTVLLSITTSFGLLFTIGVPFTSLTPLLPFIMFGVGLDDAFIISGAYVRTDHTRNAVDRINATMEDIGGTILLTTLTSALAFALGLISSIPAVQYLVLYGFPTILIDYLYQITFFVALIVIDQKRIDDNRRDCCFWCTAKNASSDTGDEQDAVRQSEKHFADRIMVNYTNWLLRPAVKWLVIVFFAAMLGFLSWRTSLLKQYFDFTDVIPSDSYIQTWWDTYQEHYEANGVRAGVYFRDVDFSDESIQDQMEAYVSELADMKYAGEDEPFEFWLWDFKLFVEEEGLQDLSFQEQIKAFLADPIHYDSYGEDIVLDENGIMTTSRTLIRLDNVDEQDVLETVDVLEMQRSISESQPVNEGRKEWAFFTFAGDYYIWEFYRVSPDELRLTVVIGIVTVSVLALLFIPHWSAIFFVGPMVAVLYIDLLGFIELCGVHVNPVMYISTVMSIGLMVDFVMHVTLRFMETSGTSRIQKTKDTMETIGASVMVGGISTLVGVLPLALSSSEIFFTTFIVFFGLVLLGLAHGLILLPVLLSMLGPLDSIAHVGNDQSKHVVDPALKSSTGADSDDIDVGVEVEC